MRLRSLVVLLAGYLLIATPAFAQNPTGTISGRVTGPDGLSLPGVMVTATSPSLQGARTAVTSQYGDYIIPLLPPGDYTVTFELTNFRAVQRPVGLGPTETVSLNVALTIAEITEVVTVVGTGTAEPFTQTAVVATRFKQELMASLPTARTLLAAVNLAPAVHNTGPNRNVSFNGAMSFENVFMLNGVVIQDNVRSTPFNLFIEDAIQELTVATSGISAEYGRFGGGMVNAITKSGGNTFTGSFRGSLTNDDWRSTTPFGEPKTDKVVPTYEYTIGGPIARDRLWFFSAGRFEENVESRQTRFTNLAYDVTDDEKRYEGKLTYSFDQNHAVKGAYINIQRAQLNNSFGTIMDRRSLYDRALPQDLLSIHYTGVLRPNFFVEGTYASRHFTFKNSGSRFTDLLQGTLLLDRRRGPNARYWAPTFCGVCDDEKRDNENIVAKSSYFLSTESAGAHNVVFGFDTFNDKRFANNHQSGSDWRIFGTTSIIQGDNIFPQFLGDGSTLIQFNPILVGSEGTNFRTHSLFVNDNWQLNDHFSFNLGLRWDKNDGEDAAGQKTVKDQLLSPRVAAIWDPTGRGVWSVSGSYARYVAAIANSVADSSSPGGQPATLRWQYFGPSINVDPSGPLVTADGAIQRLFDWFNANGGQNRPPVLVDLPGIATKIPKSLKSPHVDEVSVGVSRQFRYGTVRADAVYRDYRDFYSTHVDPSTGKASDNRGQTFDLNIIENTNDVERQYAGLALQGEYRFGDWLDLGGNYTLSRTWGNFNGETGPSGPVTTGVNFYPEYIEQRWNTPVGDLAADQRHKIRVWGTYTPPFWQRAGLFTIGVIEQMETGTPYAASGPIDVRPYVTNPGYITPQGGDSVTYFFTARDAFRTETMYRTDIAVNYRYRIPGAGTSEVFFQGQVLNLFDQFAVFNVNNINTSLLTPQNAPRDVRAFNPFTATPVEGVNWRKADLFAKPISRFAYTTPRTLLLSIGVRF